MPKQDARLAQLPLPLRSIGAEVTIPAGETMGEGKIFGGGTIATEHRSATPMIEGAFLDLGGLPILSGRTTPHHAWEWDTGRTSVTMCYSGAPHYTDGATSIQVRPGDILAVPLNGGQISTGYLASINFPVEHSRLRRTMRAMHCAGIGNYLEQALAISAGRESSDSASGKMLFALFNFIDLLLQESRHLGKAMGLDEQIYRTLALVVDQIAGAHGKTKTRWLADRGIRSHPLDNLVDYIRANAHLNLTLTDLEEQSWYSARHLQAVFREKFDCTPMQFVRRQRLSMAMEQLQSAGDGTTATTIARDCGYRFISNFSHDFKREFGMSPSMVLRSAGGVCHPGDWHRALRQGHRPRPLSARIAPGLAADLDDADLSQPDQAGVADALKRQF
ncbi:MAG: helix-turn-helix transcriptional regulator [Cyanobacteriota bacterium]